MVIPVNLELSDSRLFNEDVPGKSGDVWLGGRVLIEFSLIIVVVHIVTNSEELLVVV